MKAMTVDQIMEILKRCPFTPWQQVAQAIYDGLPEVPESSATIEVTTHSATVTYPDGGYVLFRGELANALKLHEAGTYRLAVERVKTQGPVEYSVLPPTYILAEPVRRLVEAIDGRHWPEGSILAEVKALLGPPKEREEPK